MKKEVARLLLALLLFLGLLAVCTYGFIFHIREQEKKAETKGEQILLLNEIEHLTRQSDGSNRAASEIKKLEQKLRSSEVLDDQSGQVLLVYALAAGIYMIVVVWVLYRKLIRPFGKLESFASEVASGNLEATLQYERMNFFGSFTWAFDHMREEIVKARKRETKAIEENKTIVATLSHDIKTPIASIQTYAEALEAGIDHSYEARQRYVSVIMKKCDEVTQLTNDLVLHSLSELNKLEMVSKKQSIGETLSNVLNDLAFPNVKVMGEIPEQELEFDEKRLAQVIENLLNNAKKYAKGATVEIYVTVENNRYCIHIKDHGPGILPEDLPFIKEKFYRGKNVDNQPGSGLGLFIVDYIMTAMNGGLELMNRADGLECIVWLPILLKIS